MGERDRLRRERRAARGDRRELLAAWVERGDERAAAALTRIGIAAGDPCRDCGGEVDAEYVDADEAVDKDLLTYGPGPLCVRCWVARSELKRRESFSGSGDVYVYQAGMFCADCGLATRRLLERGGRSPKPFQVVDPLEPYDSDDYPKGPFPDGGGDSDAPEHCGSGASCPNSLEVEGHPPVGAWLGNSLTEDGERWVREALLERPTPLAVWWARKYDVELPGELAEEEFTCSRCLRKRCRWYGATSCGECDERFCSACDTDGPSSHGGYHECYADEDDDEEDEA